MNALVIGYGNPGRQDDGLGPAVAEAVERWELPDVVTESDYQLNIEHAADVAGKDAVIFADAARVGPEPFAFGALEAAREIAFTTHALDPCSVLALCRDVYECAPPAFLLAIRGHAFEFDEGLQDRARENLEAALAFLRELLPKPVAEWPAGRPA